MKKTQHAGLVVDRPDSSHVVFGFISAVALAASLAVVLTIAFEKQTIAFEVSLAFAVAASANLPVLFVLVLFVSVLSKACAAHGARSLAAFQVRFLQSA